MDLLDKGLRDKIIGEIKQEGEKTRRAEALKRHEIYKDGGKKFLIEQIRREFDEDSLKEMRLTPINLLKKIVNKRSSVYKRPPVRMTKAPSDQALMDHYVEELSINQNMQKANRYYTLFSNTVMYVFPDKDYRLQLKVCPPYMYSLVPSPLDQTKPECVVFNSFTEEGQLFASETQPSATGTGYNQEPQFKVKGDLVASNEKESDFTHRRYVLWTKEQHVTLDEKGNVVLMDPTQGEEQVLHGLECMPVVNIAKDRDNETWATQGADMVDLTMAIQLAWSDLMTIAKHQGYGILTIVSEEAPTKMTFGLNKAIWLKANKDGVVPQLDYKSSSAPLNETKELLMELMALLLSTNDMSPKSIAGAAGGQNFTSGFHALIEMADTLEAREEDKPVMIKSEGDLWNVIKSYHNRLHDAGLLDEEAQSLGKFSEEFDPQITATEVKAIESEQERVATVKELMGMGLMTREQGLKKLNPDLTDDQVKDLLVKIDEESVERVQKLQRAMGGEESPDGQQSTPDQFKSKGKDDKSNEKESSKKSKEKL